MAYHIPIHLRHCKGKGSILLNVLFFERLQLLLPICWASACMDEETKIGSGVFPLFSSCGFRFSTVVGFLFLFSVGWLEAWFVIIIIRNSSP